MELNGKISLTVPEMEPRNQREGRKKSMAYKTEKLEARIVEKYGTHKAFCEALGIAESTLSRYLNEGRDWKGSTLMQAVSLLEIPPDEINAYFFDPRVPQTKLKGVKV